jgi:hypothetical protein
MLRQQLPRQSAWGHAAYLGLLSLGSAADPQGAIGTLPPIRADAAAP